MMGSDIERIISGIDATKDALCEGIAALSGACSYQLATTGVHGEVEIPSGASGFVQSAVAAMSSISGDVGKVKQLGSNLYVSADSFNNSYGSPWTEMSNLQSAIDALPPADSLTWRGDRTKLLCLMTIALSRAVDAKWAFVIYHDYVQRGYDATYNGNIPSVTFKDGTDADSTGNLSQNYSENVNVPQPSIDPF